MVVLPFSFIKINIDFTAIKAREKRSSIACLFRFHFILFYLRTSYNEVDIKWWKVSNKYIRLWFSQSMDNRLNYLNHVHPNVSSHHHRNLANTDDGALDFHCRKSQARIFSTNGEGINQLKSCILKYFSGIITATLLAQLIVRLTFKSGGLEIIHQTIFFYLSLFFKGNTSIN